MGSMMEFDDILYIIPFFKLITVFRFCLFRSTHSSFLFFASMCGYTCRLKCLLRLLDKGEVRPEVMQKNLKLAIQVLDAVYIDEAGR